MGAAINDARADILKGIHVPCLTWFLDDSSQEIDWTLQREHIQFLIQSGVDGGKLDVNTGAQDGHR
jgi:hypothetical protein